MRIVHDRHDATEKGRVSVEKKIAGGECKKRIEAARSSIPEKRRDGLENLPSLI